jgi:uncharacterized cupredoxin-like copper-binding protein
MGVKRISRGKLLDTEKLGQEINPGASALMQKCIISATQHRQGHKLVSDIVVDLGSSKQELISFGDESAQGDSLGAGTSVAYVAKLTNAVFGHVTSIETVCLEAFVGSAGALAGSGSIDLFRGTAGDGFLNNPDGTANAIVEDIGDAIGKHHLVAYDNTATLADEHIYFVLGDHGATDVATATATITVTETDIANFEDEVSRISLTNAAGTLVHFVADTNNNNFDGTVVANKVQLKTAASAVQIARGIARGITNHSDFTVSPVDGSSATLTVTQSAAGENGNRTNFYTDAPGLTAGVSVGDFTGGTTKGDALPITAGKFLLRITGFVAPDDI